MISTYFLLIAIVAGCGKKMGGRHCRVFVGWCGVLKLSKLTALVGDSVDTVFFADKAGLR